MFGLYHEVACNPHLVIPALSRNPYPRPWTLAFAGVTVEKAGCLFHPLMWPWNPHLVIPSAARNLKIHALE